MRFYCIRHQTVEIKVEALEHAYRYDKENFVGYPKQSGDMLTQPCPQCLADERAKCLRELREKLEAMRDRWASYYPAVKNGWEYRELCEFIALLGEEKAEEGGRG